MKVLVLNCGSSSIKFQLIDMDNENVLMKGVYERVLTKDSLLKIKCNGEKIEIQKSAYTHKEGIAEIFKMLVDKRFNVLDSLNDISVIGHRIVHGGEKLKKSVLVNEEVKKENTDLCELVGKRDKEIEKLEAQLKQARNDYNSLKMAKMIEISDGDMENAQKRISKLIRDVNKCITLISEK